MSALLEFQKSQLVRTANDVAGILAGALVGLYQAPLDIGPARILADFTGNEANYNTYAQQVLVWDTESVAADGTVESVSAALTFRPTDAVAPNSIWGLFILDTTAAFLLFAGQFDGAPVKLNSTLDQLIITVRFRPATGSIVVQID